MPNRQGQGRGRGQRPKRGNGMRSSPANPRRNRFSFPFPTPRQPNTRTGQNRSAQSRRGDSYQLKRPSGDVVGPPCSPGCIHIYGGCYCPEQPF